MKAVVQEATQRYPVYSTEYAPDKRDILDKLEIQVFYSALNHRDIWIMKGMYANIQLPCIPGSDACGYLYGKPVIINPGYHWSRNPLYPSKDFTIQGMPDPGTLADTVWVHKEQVYPKPDHLSNLDAAALPLAGVTAFRAVQIKAKVNKSENVLITGIGGGVALQAMQFCLALGANVFVTSKSIDKIHKAKQLGAIDGANYQDENYVKQLKMMSGGGFDVIIDSAGGSSLEHAVQLINPGGRIVIYGGTLGKAMINPQILFWKQASILGTSMGSDSDFDAMVQFVDTYKISPIVDKVFPLHEIQKAYQYLESGNQFGKVVIEVNPG